LSRVGDFIAALKAPLREPTPEPQA